MKGMIILGTLIFSSTLLFGCSNSDKIEQLSSDVQALNAKVDQITIDINSIRSDVQDVKDEACRANQRLDNQIASYQK